jgi:translation initiation factor IF-2
MIVALNKMDLPGADPNKVLQQLASRDVLPAEWGGDTEVVRTSAANGEGLGDLLDTILISTELRELNANPDRPAVGVCLEAFRDEGRGPVAWLIVQNGSLQVGDVILCGSAYGRVRAMYDDRDNELEEAGPSTPVRVAGLESVPSAGSHFFVLDDIEDAREIAEERQRTGRAESLASLVRRPRSLDEVLATARGGEVQDLPLIIKADTGGSIEAIRHELDKFEHPEVRIRLLHSGVGGVNESDVSLAAASGAVIAAFQVVPDDRAAALADREGVEIRRYSIIYEVMDSIRQRLEGMLKPEQREVMTGRAIVLQTFKISRTGTIAGCRVLNGTIERNNRMHVIRQQTLVSTFGIASLRREKDDVREVREGMECGIRLEGFNDIKEGDLLESFRIEQVKRTLD